MNAPMDLQGLEVLVLEDDFYLADDARRTLEEAGARVLGPFSDPADAVSAAGEQRPSCALLDINLGGGPSFQTAKTLQAMGVPIVFVTGYDADVIPTELRTAPCLQKPIEAQKIVRAISSVCQTQEG